MGVNGTKTGEPTTDALRVIERERRQKAAPLSKKTMTNGTQEPYRSSLNRPGQREGNFAKPG